MAKFIVEFSPPVKIKSKENDDINITIDYSLILAPFQKPTQVEFSNIKIKETALRYLTVINSLDKQRQFVIRSPGDGIHFDVNIFTIQPMSQYKLSITWQPSVYGNIRKLIKIEQVDSNLKYDFIILGNCIDPLHKKLKTASITYSKSKNSSYIKKNLNHGHKKIILNKTKIVNSKSERIILKEKTSKLSKTIFSETIESPIRRQTYLIGEKENCSDLKCNMSVQDFAFNSPEHCSKRPDKKRQDYVFNSHFNLQNQDNCNFMSDDSLDKSTSKIMGSDSLFDDMYLTPLKSTENLLSPFCTKSKLKRFNKSNENIAFNSFEASPFKPIDASTASKTITPEDRKPSKVSINLYDKFENTPNDELDKASTTFTKSTTDSNSLVPKIDQSLDFKKNVWSSDYTALQHTKIVSNNIKLKRPSIAIKNSPIFKSSPKTSMISKNRLKHYNILSPRIKRNKTTKLDKCDQYLKCLANPKLVYHSHAEDPFLKMSQYYEAEWLDRQETDMIRWLNALLMPIDKLADEEQSDDLELAAVAWVEASKTCHKNKPMQFATQKDLFVAQIYRQSPQQWSALRKATSNLITSTNVATVLSKLTVAIEKDLITVRDDRQIHLDLNLKKKIIDLLKCYNPLWLRIGLEAIYGQIVFVKSGSNDLDGLGWFIRKHLFNNDYVKKKFTKTNILQVNLPSYNIAMKRFILRKILMLIYFLDCAKEQKLIRHNPCLFKVDSSYKSSYDFLMGFCADMITAHGDIMRRLRSINYNLTHKQTHLDEVNYAVKTLNDLRDGTRITRVVEILFKGDPLSQKLRLPAISKLQKIHNVNLALTRISEHINIEGNISTRDIVNGHREKMLSLFWQIIYKYLTPRYNNAATKIQHWWRNNSLNLVILKRIRTKQNFKRNLAAAKIQAYFRGYMVRKQWPYTYIELIENREKLHLASTKIKQYLQNKLKLLTEERKRFIILRKTTIFIQRKFRSNILMKKERQKYLRAKQAALLIQKVYRGFIVRKNWSNIKKCVLINKTKRVNAINIIKRFLRKNLPPTKDELYYKQLIVTTLTIQRRFRGNILMKTQMEEFLKLKKITIFVQRKFRAKQALISQKEHYMKVRICILKLQALLRGYIVRKQWPALREKLMENKIKLITSSNIIKRAFRKNLPSTDDRNKFLNLKKSVVVLQQRFRAFQDMKLQRKQFLMLKISTLKLQSIVRGYLLRKQWPVLRNELQNNKMRLINSSNIIKRSLRRNLPITNDRSEFIKLKTASVVLQRRFRAMKLMKYNREKYIKMRVNVIKLQSLVRGFIVRKQWPLLRSQLQAYKMYLNECSNIISRSLRKNLPLTKDRIRFLEFKKSVLIIQRRFRALQIMRQQRKHYLLLKKVTVKLQSLTRGHIQRKRWSTLRNELISNRQHLVNCSNVIKRTLRKNLPVTYDRLNFLELKKVVLIIQNRFRVHMQRKTYLSLRDNVIVIQRRFRANIVMRKQKLIFNNTKVMIIKLQAYFKGYLVRKKWHETKLTLEVNRKRLIMASNTIKRFLRKCLPPTSERSKYLLLKQAVINIQTRYRAMVAMKVAKREYLLLKSKVIILQRYYRTYKAMMRQKQHYEHIKKSTVLLQAHIKGYLTRKHWPQLKHNMEIHKKCITETFECKRLLATHAYLIELNMEIRAAVQLQNWTRNLILIREHLQKQNVAALKIQAVFKGFLVRKRLPQIKYELKIQKQVYAATIIQAIWRGFCVRKRYQCRRNTIRIPKKGALTLGRRHNDVVDVLNKQKRNEYSYRELATVFWNLDTCTSLSKELCVKTTEGMIVDYMFHFLQYSNQSQPSIEAREPAIRVLTNLLKYHETSWQIWMRTIKADMVKELIKMMKTCCGKIGATRLYCSIATWLWIALQDPEKKRYIKNIPFTIVDMRYMMDSLNKKYKIRKVDKKSSMLPSTRPTWSIGSKCQKCFDSDFYATVQLCKLLDI